MNIGSNNALRQCTSCQMCAAVCPHDAIKIELNPEGFYRPIVDRGKCVDCGLCVKVCYKFDENLVITPSDELRKMPLYAAKAKDEGLLEYVTSGGIADIMAKQLIDDGYVCIGVGYDDENTRAYDYCATTTEETNGFRGSKYIQSYTYDAFKQLVCNSRKEKFAVFGTPCHTYAIHQYLEQRHLRDRCVLIDLFCHGCPSLHVWRKYQREVKETIGKPKFDHVNFRSKVKGWGNFYVVVVVDGLRAFVSSPKKDEFYELFFSDTVLNGACADCKLRSTMAYTDIRLGDFWGKKYALDMKGVSAVVLATEQGRSLYEKIEDKIDSSRSDYSDMLPFQSYGKTYTLDIALREEMLAQLALSDMPLARTVALFHRHQGLAARLKRVVKRILYYLPPSMTMILKKVIKVC